MNQNGGDYVTRVAQGVGWKQVGEGINLQSPLQQTFTTPYGNTVNHFMNNYKKNGGVDFDSLSEVLFDVLSDMVVDEIMNDESVE